jgi:predicted CXXCH cytochrome family protein
MVLYSCGSGSSDNILNFLFDGVSSADTVNSENEPVIKSDSLSNSNQNINKPFAPTFVLHVPYEEKMCESCHDINNSFKKTMNLPELCYQCHEDFQLKYKNLHYPVEAGECTTCHHPHQAKLSNLLLKPVRELCAECHDLDELLSGELHNGIGDMDCSECHNPHGSDESSLLR